MVKDSNTQRFTASAALAAIGAKISSVKLLDPIYQHVEIAQKTVRYAPLDKLIDLLIAVLAGAESIVEIDSRVRADVALQRAFGRQGCAEQSVIQRTLNACTEQNVKQLRYAQEIIYQQRSRAYRHHYSKALQLLDIDFSGLLCGAGCELASKGYFSNQRTSQTGHARGRQLGRVIACEYKEVVCDLLFAGNCQLNGEYQTLVKAAEQALTLTADKRQRTLIRMDSAGGAIDSVNWLLERGYRIMVKAYSSAGLSEIAGLVEHWYDDPRHQGRQIGELKIAADQFMAPVRRILVRSQRHKTKTWAYGMTISNLLPHEARNIAHCSPDELKLIGIETLAYAWAYDARGGTIEIELKEDKQGLGITKRQKKRAAAQQIVMLINQLAHNILVWARNWIKHHAPELARFGILRWVRDLLHTSGQLSFNAEGLLVKVVLNKAAPYARQLLPALTGLMISQQLQVQIALGQI